jgi:hypothetical protein
MAFDLEDEQREGTHACNIDCGEYEEELVAE